MNAAVLAAAARAYDTRRLSILHLVDSLELGGLERVVTDLAVAQHAHGHAVAVFSLGDTQGLGSELEAAGVPVLAGNKCPGLDRVLLRRLRGTLAARGVEVVHSHNFVPNYYAAMALGWPRPRGRVLVNTCHNMGSRLAATRLRWLYRLSLARTARVAGVGEQVRQRLVSGGLVPARRAATVLNGVPLPPVAGPAERQSARARLGLAGDALVLGSVGRLVALKDHRLLLQELPALAHRFPALQLVLIGDGPLRTGLERTVASLGIADRVRFAGARGDVAQLLPALDVFVLPSRTEGLSIALLEACAAGLATVASAVGGNPEIVRDGDTGRLFASGDGATLRRTLESLLADPAARARLGGAARAWVGAHASMPALRTSYDAFYAQALGEPARCG
ncbi:glycosyltransferase [Lysobacter sp. GX 14042]|uniref:glycosyltransferase n=1 Tax=Lysobacter sp. GX 14042 TaxID=2907155 RepID=UPI001F338624|nr:glycosyltransferase [Lysobacter sp. GX 14042]MCE7032676.1 glycosyltransferase [Lysobacter sp. GX 14042]